MFMFAISKYSGLPLKIRRPKILQLPVLGTLFLNPGLDTALRQTRLKAEKYI